jgi:ribosomal protein L40E
MSTPPATPTGLTHACARCGAPVPLDVGLCEKCNPLGLRDAASSQAHGTIFLGIGVAVVGLMLVGLLAVRGIGPFPAEVTAFRAQGDDLRVTLSVTNKGTAMGSTTCRISDPTSDAGQAGFVQSPRIQPGATLEFEATVTGLGTTPRQLAAECSAP